MSAPPPPTAPPHPDGAGTDPSEGPGPRRLTRYRRGRLVGGVAAGLGRYLGVDRVVVRIAFVVLAFVPFPGFGVLLYLAMLLLVPEQDADGAVVPTRLTERTPAFWVGVGLVGIATFALLGVVVDGRGNGLVPLLLIGLGVALWVDADRRPSGPSPDPSGRTADPAPPAPTPPSTASWQPPAASAAPVWEVAEPRPTTGHDAAGTARTDGASWAPTDPSPSPGGATPPPAHPPAPSGPAWTPPPVPARRPRSPLGRITVGLALLAGGTAWAIDLLEVRDVPIASMLAIVLLVLGAGLLVGSIVGRARWLVALVAVVLPATLVAVAIDDLGIDLRGGFDERELLVTDVAQLDEPVTIAAGSLTLDLRDLDAAGEVTVDASVGAGELIVVVPEGAGLRGDARVEFGELRLFNDISTGVSVRRTLTSAAEPGRPTFDLDLRVGAGELRLRTVPVSGTDTGGGDPAVTDGASVTDDASVSDDPMTDDATAEVQP